MNKFLFPKDFLELKFSWLTQKEGCADLSYDQIQDITVIFSQTTSVGFAIFLALQSLI